MSDTTSNNTIAFVRDEMLTEQAAPAGSRGLQKWIWDNILSSMTNFSTIGASVVSSLMIVLTLGSAWLAYQAIEFVVTFGFVNAVWSGENREACATIQQGGVRPDGSFGACWAYVDAYMSTFIYGRYPEVERWRVDWSAILFFGGLIPLLMPKLPYKRENLIYMAVFAPLAVLILLTGGNFDFGAFLPAIGVNFWIDFAILAVLIAGGSAYWAYMTAGDPKKSAISVLVVMAAIAAVIFIMTIDFGLEHVETEVWGGLLVTLVIAITGIAASLPLGIALALGRRSEMPIVRMVCIIFIEFWRGVPLITVLFMSSVMLPLFLPDGVTFDKLLRALIGVGLFSAAYMAEVVRGGLQAIPKGQYEGAMALGLTFWQMINKIIMPQALKLVIPGIVNTFIGLFKDTTLVLIIGLFDFLGMIQSSFTDATWSTPLQSLTGYLFAALVYWVFCFSMSRYSIFMENRLNTGHKR